MTNEKKERITELESKLEIILDGATDFDEKYQRIKKIVSDYFSGKLSKESEREKYEIFCSKYWKTVSELSRLYDELIYNPAEDEKTLDYLFRDGMTREEKLSALSNAWWYATNSGYCDAMANRLMAGEDSPQTQIWEQNCENKGAIGRYYNWLNEQSED